MLIFCQDDGDAPPATVGARQIRLDTSALAGAPAHIERRLQTLADQIAEKARSSRSP